MLRYLTTGESHGPCLISIVEGLPYGTPFSEEPINAEVIVETDKESVDESAAKIVAKLEALGYLTPVHAAAEAS